MTDVIPVLSLHQPWASLVALGVKNIETRSWSTKYRGPLAIHATARKLAQWLGVGQYTVHEMTNGSFHAINEDDVSDYLILPLGAIVATCTLADVVPITDSGKDGTATISQHGSVLWQDDGRACWPISDQLPYGDFTPGRYAWLLSDIEPLDKPVPFKGGQGLTKRWKP